MTQNQKTRGFTVVEVVVVVAVVGVVAAVGAIGVSTAVERSKRDGKLKAVFAQLEQVRAKHLSATASPDACLRFTKTGASTFELDERLECATPGRPVTLDLGAPILARDEFCIDSLARPVQCNDLATPRDVAFDIELDGQPPCDGIVVWRKNGRLTANFPVDDMGNDVQAHLVDAASMITPEPTAVGRYAGVSTNPRGILE